MSARNPAYAFLRGFMGPMLQDLTTYTVISDMMRGLPAMYALYAGYDDLGHFAGMQTPEERMRRCTRRTTILPGLNARCNMRRAHIT